MRSSISVRRKEGKRLAAVNRGEKKHKHYDLSQKDPDFRKTLHTSKLKELKSDNCKNYLK